MKKVILDPITEQTIIEFYLAPNMLKTTADKFSISRKVLYRILKNHNIALHNQTVICELRKKSYIEHYGVEHPMLANDVVKKYKQTCLEKYGVDNVSKFNEIKAKKQATCLKNFGVDNPNKAKEIKEKKKQTCKDRYGVETPFQDTKARQKAVKTYLDRLGVSNPLKSQEIKLKCKKTCQERYGVDSYTQTAEYVKKSKQTSLLKYGTEHYAQTLEFHKKAKKHYKFNNETFDSFPELCIYIYAIVNNIKISRVPVQLHFIFEGKKHVYIPDFMIDDVLYEIKGNQFLKNDGTWCCPFNHSLDELFEAKHQCALANNVKILYYNDYKKYID